MSIDPVCGLHLNETEAAAAALHNGRIYYFCSPEHKEQFVKDPGSYAPGVPAMALKVGVMGSASGELSPEVRKDSFDLGAAIAVKGMICVTGAAPGLPWESARGAQAAGGLSVGISPALSLDEHVNTFRSPADAFDILIYTGSGLMGREIVNIRSSDIVIIVAGQSGTLGEFAIAYDEGKLVGLLKGSGGVADHIPELLKVVNKATGAEVISDTDPERLIDRLTDLYVQKHFQRPSVFTHADLRGHRAAG